MWSGLSQKESSWQISRKSSTLARYQRLGHLERSCSTAWRMQEYIQGMHTGWKKIIALRHLQWKGKVCLIAILKISQSSGLSPKKKGGIGKDRPMLWK